MTGLRFEGVEALSFDFYRTLARHRTGRGRGAEIQDYLAAHGVGHRPWEHRILYEVFRGGTEGGDRPERLTARLFEALEVDVPRRSWPDHASAVHRLLGPASLELYPEVPAVLEALSAARVPMVVTSNWQRGLDAFCEALGFRHHVVAVLASADVGSEKPDAGIFRLAVERLAVPAGRVLHVGDTLVDDVHGARAAGMQSLWVRRGATSDPDDVTWMDDLTALPRALGVAGS